MDRLYAVLMAGGSGTRFWPASRRDRPKQFLPITGGESLIAATRARVAPLVPPERTLVVAGASHAALVREALPELPPENLLCEPRGRNTLAAVALAAAELGRRDPDSVQAVLPSDHVIAPEEAFRASLEAAAAVAVDSGALVTFGVRPTRPATGYGYIEMGTALDPRGEHPVHDVAQFVEKPEPARAKEYLESGRFLWNSGVFVWTTAAVARALAEHAPREWSLLAGADPGDLEAVYAELESRSIDVGVLEKAGERRVMPIDYVWSDVGSWAALPEVLRPDGGGNFGAGGGRVEALGAQGNVVHAAGDELVALVGVDDLVVVRAGKTTLVVPRGRAEEVRELVERLEADAPEWT